MDRPPIFQPQPSLIVPGTYPAAVATHNFLYCTFTSPNYAGIAVNPPNPPYPEMITTEIARLMEIPKVKTSKKEIGECIAATYNLLPSYMKLVTEYLKRMTNSGQLVRVGNSYLHLPHPPTPAPAATASPAGFAGSSTLTKRGRPPKPKPSPAESLPASGEAHEVSAVLLNGAVTSAKKRGRPRKVKPDAASAGVFNPQEPQPQPAVDEASPVSVYNGVGHSGACQWLCLSAKEAWPTTGG